MQKRIRFTSKSFMGTLLICLLLMPSTETFAQPPRKTIVKPFLFITEGELWDYNVVMHYPWDNENRQKDALEKLQAIMKNWPSDRLATMHVSREDQIGTLKALAPLVDQASINPFVHFNSQAPAADDPIWPNVNQPVINKVRELRSSYPKRLLATIDMNGEPAIFNNRHATFDEFQWMAFAAIGANYQGIVLRGIPFFVDWANQARLFRTQVLRYADNLGSARPVKWAAGSNQTPVSALISANRLFVVLLHPDYLKPCPCCRKIHLPKNPPTQKGTVTITLPSDVNITTGTTLTGEPLQLRHERQMLQVNYHFDGGGEMLIFTLSKPISDQEKSDKPHP